MGEILDPEGKNAPKDSLKSQDEVIASLEEYVAALEGQLAVPLTPAEVRMMRDLLGEQKDQLKHREEILYGFNLIDKLDGYLRPPLFDKESTSEDADGA